MPILVLILLCCLLLLPPPTPLIDSLPLPLIRISSPPPPTTADVGPRRLFNELKSEKADLPGEEAPKRNGSRVLMGMVSSVAAALTAATAATLAAAAAANSSLVSSAAGDANLIELSRGRMEQFFHPDPLPFDAEMTKEPSRAV